jgi:hypothetical protein
MESADPPSWRRLPGPGAPVPDEARARSRYHGIRQVRRLSNWTAVVLVAATAVTAGYFAHAPHPSAQQSIPLTGAQSQVPRTNSGAPCVTTPVAVSGGSGVTTTVPSRSCAQGTGGGNRPAVVYVKQGEGRGD